MTANLSPPAKLQFFDANGDPLVGGKLYTYAAGTTTPLATYTDYGAGTPNANPVITDSRGECSVWLGASLYKFALYTSANVLIWTVDNISAAASLAALAGTGGSALVGYIQAGTAPTTQTVQARLRKFVLVTDFGADPTGATAANTAFANALSLCSSTGQALYVPGTSAYYKLTASVAVPAGVTIYGDGYNSVIRQVTVDQNLFIPAGQNEFHNLHLQGLGADTPTDPLLNHGIHCGAINNVKIHDCWFSRFYASSIYCAEAHNITVQNNVFFQNFWPQTIYGSALSSQADILFYSATSGGRTIITGNFHFSDMSQAIFFNAIGGDQDAIIANNLIQTLDANWSPVTVSASMVGRHGIFVNYATAVGTQNTKVVVQGNVIKYKNWAGIYCQSDDGLYTGSLVIDSNVISNVALANSSGLGGGIRVSTGQAGGITITNNNISTVVNAADNGIGVQTNSVSGVQAGRTLVMGNTITGCLGEAAIGLVTYIDMVDVINNQIYDSGINDIRVSPTALSATNGRCRILGNRIKRSNTTTVSILYQGNVAVANAAIEIANNWIEGFDKTVNAATNAAIYFSNSNIVLWNVHHNHIQEFYYGVINAGYIAVGRHFDDMIIDGNDFQDLNTAVDMSSNVTTACLFLTNSTFRGVTNHTGVGVLAGNQAVYEGTRSGTLIEISAAAAPTTGTYIDGDHVWYTTIAAGASPGAVCTTPGAAGTFVFKGMAALAA